MDGPGCVLQGATPKYWNDGDFLLLNKPPVLALVSSETLVPKDFSEVHVDSNWPATILDRGDPLPGLSTDASRANRLELRIDHLLGNVEALEPPIAFSDIPVWATWSISMGS